MNVYVIEGGYDYEGFDILGIYSTKELAESELEKVKQGKRIFDSLDIEQVELDKPIED